MLSEDPYPVAVSPPRVPPNAPVSDVLRPAPPVEPKASPDVSRSAKVFEVSRPWPKVSEVSRPWPYAPEPVLEVAEPYPAGLESVVEELNPPVVLEELFREESGEGKG